MPPVGVGASRFASALETGEAKLWVVLLGINDYQDEALPKLRYAAFDCHGIGEALAAATQAFPQKEFFIHHDLASEKPTLKAIRSSLNRVVTSARTQDTVLLYFSGHGVLEPESQQTVLCVADTQKQQLLSTGLCFQDLLSTLGKCAAHSQLIWLDACHSGNVSLSGARGHLSETVPLNPTPQLLELLRQRAAKSRGFYALLSCDQGQQSWEFPDLGHGVFSYYLMRGLRGEAAGAYGIIDADALYRYVYHQTLQYIEQTNQQLRLINQQKRNKGETDLHPEYSLQTPKRIVEGIGETILGLKPMSIETWQRRQALIVDGLVHRALSPSLCEVLEQDGNFDLAYFPQPADVWSNVRSEIAAFLQQEITLTESRAQVQQPIATRLLYLRGRLESSTDGEAWLFLGDGAWISRAWLRQELRRSRTAQQIVILDCPGATSIEDWIEDLKFASGHGQCILACASPPDEPELFSQVLLEVLVATPAQTGLSMAGLLARLQTNLDGLGLTCHLWLSGTQGLIEMLPTEIEAQTVQRSLTAAQDDRTSTISEIPLTELVEQITPLLLKFTGPIAPSLLEQVVNSLEEWDFQSLIRTLSLHLPAKYRTPFEQEANLLQTTARTSNAVEPIQSLSSDPTDPDEASSIALPKQLDQLVDQTVASSLSTKQMAEIEQFLLKLVGPIAPTLLGQLSPAACEPTVMIEELSVYLSATQQTKLTDKISVMMQSSPAQDSQSSQAKGDEGATRSPNRTEADTSDRMVDNQMIKSCEQELTRLIGPIAKYIVTAKRDLENQVSLTTFVEILIAEIPDAQKAKEFRQKMLKN
ncbi:MAG: caspase family protein [Phormidium tanganyikae FI6-MK23]|jgi:uncharacterized caspase-like protein|nr:caspase family protein [Phormidium tanganyikae FI6-MK23]